MVGNLWTSNTRIKTGLYLNEDRDTLINPGFISTIDSLFRKSCGVLPYRMVNGERKFLLVFENYSQCWSLPKGHMEAGETEIETALRELYEETGLTAQLDTGRSASIEYPVSDFSRKQVVFYLGQVIGEPRVRAGEIDGFK